MLALGLNMVTENLKEMSPTELAKFQADWKERTPNDILSEKEWQRRFMLEQHELDKRLMLKQVKWMKISVISGFLGIITGALITGFATMATQQTQEIEQIKPLQSQAQEKTDSVPSAD